MIRIGPFEIHSVVTGTFRLDGGAMFGVVPKVLWSNRVDADEQNRISMTTRTLLAVDRSGRRVVISDTGCGTKWAPQQAERFAIQHRAAAVTDALSSMQLTTDDVTDVVVTHLHFDHNGGLTEWVDQPGGSTRLCFPRARHWIHRGQWEHANRPHYKDRASYLPVDFQILAESRLLNIVEGTQPLPPFDGLQWFISQGHTPHHLHPLFVSDRGQMLFVGDLVPTVAHLPLPWVMAYDLLPMTTIAEKIAIFRRGIEQGLILAFAHDPTVAAVSIDGTPERPVISKTW